MAELHVDDVEVTFHPRGGPSVVAVAGASLTVSSGEIVGLVGESGCGKSSLARSIAGLVAPSRGRVTVDGEPVRQVGWRRRSANDRRVQMVFQDPNSSLNPRRRIGPQIADGIIVGPAGQTAAGITGKTTGETTGETTGQTKGSSPRQQRVMELLDRVGMPRSAVDRYPHQFSGGQRQRLAVARALGPAPQFLVADEPVTALDASAQAQVVGVLQALVEAGLGIVFITHDLALVNEIADRIAVMYLGQIVEHGPAEEILRHPRHPYTRSLIDAIPRIAEGGGARSLPVPLEGEVPDPAHAPAGCRFHPRCPWAVEACLQPQVLRAVGERHEVACHRAEELGHVPDPQQHATGYHEQHEQHEEQEEQ